MNKLKRLTQQIRSGQFDFDSLDIFAKKFCSLKVYFLNQTLDDKNQLSSLLMVSLHSSFINHYLNFLKLNVSREHY